MLTRPLRAEQMCGCEGALRAPAGGRINAALLKATTNVELSAHRMPSDKAIRRSDSHLTAR